MKTGPGFASDYGCAKPNFGRILMATARHATVAVLSTSFGAATFVRFAIVADEVLPNGR